MSSTRLIGILGFDMNANRIENLKVRQMSIIVALADGKSRNDVSYEKGVTGSAITLCVQRAEDMLGIKIFVRDRKGWTTPELTPDGQSIVAMFRQVLAILSGKEQGESS